MKGIQGRVLGTCCTFLGCHPVPFSIPGSTGGAAVRHQQDRTTCPMEAQKPGADFSPMLVTGFFDMVSAFQDTLLCLQVIANTKVGISTAAHKLLAWCGSAPTINFKAQSAELHHTCKEWRQLPKNHHFYVTGELGLPKLKTIWQLCCVRITPNL